MAQPLRKKSLIVSHTVKHIHVLFDLTILLLRIFPREMKTYAHKRFLRSLTAALFIAAKPRNHLNHNTEDRSILLHVYRISRTKRQKALGRKVEESDEATLPSPTLVFPMLETRQHERDRRQVARSVPEEKELKAAHKQRRDGEGERE